MGNNERRCCLNVLKRIAQSQKYGGTCYIQKDYPHAINDYTECIEISPLDKELYLLRAGEYKKSNPDQLEDILRDTHIYYAVSAIKGVEDTKIYEEVKDLARRLAQRKATAIMDQRKKDHFVRSFMNPYNYREFLRFAYSTYRLF